MSFQIISSYFVFGADRRNRTLISTLVKLELNFSKVDDSYLQVTLNTAIDYQNPCQIFLYSLQYNVFNIIDGIGGLKYYL